MVPKVVAAAAEVMSRIQSVTCCQPHAAMAPGCDTDVEAEAVAVTTENSSTEMTEEGEAAARCSVLLVSSLTTEFRQQCNDNCTYREDSRVKWKTVNELHCVSKKTDRS